MGGAAGGAWVHRDGWLVSGSLSRRGGEAAVGAGGSPSRGGCRCCRRATGRGVSPYPRVAGGRPSSRASGLGDAPSSCPAPTGRPAPRSAGPGTPFRRVPSGSSVPVAVERTCSPRFPLFASRTLALARAGRERRPPGEQDGRVGEGVRAEPRRPPARPAQTGSPPGLHRFPLRPQAPGRGCPRPGTGDPAPRGTAQPCLRAEPLVCARRRPTVPLGAHKGGGFRNKVTCFGGKLTVNPREKHIRAVSQSRVFLPANLS